MISFVKLTLLCSFCYLTGCSTQPAPVAPIPHTEQTQVVNVDQSNVKPISKITTTTNWQSLGMGGGGAFFFPAASPHDSNLLFVSSDMGGLYRSENKGQTWQMIDWRQMRYARSIIFHPTNKQTIYAIPWEGDQFKVSHNKGLTWKLVESSQFTTSIWEGETFLSMTIDKSNPKLMLLSSEEALYRTTDAGDNWERLDETPEKLTTLHIDQTSSRRKRICYAANEENIYRSDDGGTTWKKKNNGLPWNDIRHFTASSSEKNKQTILFCTIPSKKIKGKFAGGVYRSIDRGESWVSAMGDGIHVALGLHPYGEDDIDQYYLLAQPEDEPQTIYVTNRGTGYDPPHHYTVYRSTDAGKTWKDVFFNDPRSPKNNTAVGWLFYGKSRGFGEYALGFTVNPRNADQLLYTNYGEVFLTNDAGRKWKQIYSKAISDSPRRVRSIGLEDTSCWKHIIDPNNNKRRFICYTDIGLARSDDLGKTWSYAAKGIPWSNTIYDLAFDPKVVNKIWAACSNQHDIPMWRYIRGPTKKGGVVVSSDAGKTWKVTSNGLPAAPVTAIVVDPTSSIKQRRLYAGVYGYGVYVSNDAGASWKFSGDGIEPKQNRQVVAIKQADDGTLFCSVAARRKGNGVNKNLTGGLYRSINKGKTWQKISSPEIYRTVDFAIHPNDNNSIYVATMDGMGHDGGVFITHNGGKIWRHTVPNFDRKHGEYIEGYSVALHPKIKDKLYFLTVTHGLFISNNDGKSWEATSPEKSPPFMSTLRLQHDPADISKVFITTFGGGVWHGKVD